MHKLAFVFLLVCVVKIPQGWLPTVKQLWTWQHGQKMKCDNKMAWQLFSEEKWQNMIQKGNICLFHQEVMSVFSLFQDTFLFKRYNEDRVFQDWEDIFSIMIHYFCFHKYAWQLSLMNVAKSKVRWPTQWPSSSEIPILQFL